MNVSGQNSSRSGGRRAVMLAKMDCSLEHDTEFNSWYWEEHIPDRLAIPGVLSALRFVRASHPRYLTWYDLESAAVLNSEAYAVLHREWSDRTRWILTEVGYSITRELYEDVGDPKADGATNFASDCRELLIHDVSKGHPAAADLTALAAAEVDMLKPRAQVTATRRLARVENVAPGPNLLRFVPDNHPHFLLAHVLGEQSPANPIEGSAKKYGAEWAWYRRLTPGA